MGSWWRFTILPREGYPVNETEIVQAVWDRLHNLYDREVADRCAQQVAWMPTEDDEITDTLVERLAQDWITP